MTLDDLNEALKAFRRRLLKNGTWDDGSIELRCDCPDWDWVTFWAKVHIKETGRDAIINASWNSNESPVRLCNWEGVYAETPWEKYDVI